MKKYMTVLNVKHSPVFLKIFMNHKFWNKNLRMTTRSWDCMGQREKLCQKTKTRRKIIT